MKQKQSENKLLYLSPDKLITHPKNLRRFYLEYQVREMAESIKASKGVYQAMLIVRAGKDGRYFVVDGNIRLAGARVLGKDCPPLKCELVDQSTAEQLLAMAATAKFRYDPDPISEALHYKRLMDEEGYNVPQLGRALGISPTQLYIQMKLLKLDKEIQALIGARKLPRDDRAVDALLSIPDAKARVKLAERMAAMEASIKAIVAACERLKEQLMMKAKKRESPSAPAIAIAQGRSFESDFQVGRSSKPFDAVGCGEHIALGAMEVLQRDILASPLSAADKIHLVLNAAAEFSAGVAPPFLVLSSDGTKKVFEK